MYMRSKRFNVYFGQEFLAEIDKAAGDAYETRSQYIRVAVNQRIVEEKRVKDALSDPDSYFHHLKARNMRISSLKAVNRYKGSEVDLN
jgi:hypothetical protein